MRQQPAANATFAHGEVGGNLAAGQMTRLDRGMKLDAQPGPLACRGLAGRRRGCFARTTRARRSTVEGLGEGPAIAGLVGSGVGAFPPRSTSPPASSCASIAPVMACSSRRTCRCTRLETAFNRSSCTATLPVRKGTAYATRSARSIREQTGRGGIAPFDCSGASPALIAGACDLGKLSTLSHRGWVSNPGSGVVI
jgi:hypothetical protein